MQRLSEEQRHRGSKVTIVFNQGSCSHVDDLQVLSNINLRKVRPQVVRDFFFYFAIIVVAWRKKLRPDVIHIHGDLSAFMAGVVLSYIAKCNLLVASVHGAIKPGRFEWLYRKTLRFYKLVYCTGSRDAKHLRSIGVETARWQTSGVDEIFYAGGEENGIHPDLNADVVIVGSCVPIKNLSLVIEIAEIAKELRFLIIGDGPERHSLEEKSKLLDLKNLRFAGQKSSACIRTVFSRSPIFLSTSLSEGTPTSIMEAMACGLTIVTSASNDYESLIKPDRNGYVVKGFLAADYVCVIRLLMNNRELRQQIAMHNRADAMSCKWPAVAARLESWMLND